MPTTLQEIVMNVETDPRWVGEGKFDVASARLMDLGKRFGISLNYMNAGQLALARMAYGSDSEFSTTGLWVPNDHIYDVGSYTTDFLIVDERYSIIFGNPVETTEAQRRRKEFDASKAYDRLRQLASPHAFDALKTGVLLVTRSSYRRELPTNAFGQLDVPVFIFGGETTARDYGTWLKTERRIATVNHFVLSASYTDTFYHSDKKKPLVRGLWVHDLGNRSDLGSSYDLSDGSGLLYPNGRVRGITQHNSLNNGSVQ